MTLSDRIARSATLETDRPVTALQTEPTSVLTHAHDGGTVHNHTGYSAELMAAPGAIHTHQYRADWNPAISPFVARALAHTLPAKVLR